MATSLQPQHRLAGSLSIKSIEVAPSDSSTRDAPDPQRSSSYLIFRPPSQKVSIAASEQGCSLCCIFKIYFTKEKKEKGGKRMKVKNLCFLNFFRTGKKREMKK